MGDINRQLVSTDISDAGCDLTDAADSSRIAHVARIAGALALNCPICEAREATAAADSGLSQEMVSAISGLTLERLPAIYADICWLVDAALHGTSDLTLASRAVGGQHGMPILVAVALAAGELKASHLFHVLDHRSDRSY